MTDIEEFIEQLHFCCISIAIDASTAQVVVRKRLVDFLHSCHANLPLNDERRVIVDRMAEQIAAELLIGWPTIDVDQDRWCSWGRSRAAVSHRSPPAHSRRTER